MKQILQSIREAVILYFAPLATVWFWLAVIALTIFFFNTAEAGYMWTD